MNWRDSSLRRRLLLWLLVPLLSLSALMLFEVRASAIKSANRVYDRVLLGSALAISERVVLENDSLEVDVPYVALEMLTSAAQDRVFYQVLGPGGAFITGYDDLPTLQSPSPSLPVDQPSFYDANYRGERIRVVSVSKFISNRNLSTRYQVKVAETILAREALAGEILTGSILRLLALIVLAALITWFGVGRGLAPLRRLEKALDRRSPSDLRKIRHEVPQEVRHLVGAINSLMIRLGDALESTRQFTGNVAHQLRTPLAAIRTHTELALREKDPQKVKSTLEDLVKTCDETTHLVNQLLSLAMVSQSDLGEEGTDPADLQKIAAEICKKYVPAALTAQIDLGLDSPDGTKGGDFVVHANAILVAEALSNLISNALSYCPPHSLVTVRLRTADKTATLSVEDTGPGIADNDLKKVQQRFYRAEPAIEGQVSGCGLGLAIVKEIAERQGAVFELAPNPNARNGLLASLVFQRR